MPSANPSRVLIVGCGASLRRDDQAGLRIGESLAAGGPPDGVEVELTESPAGDIPALLEGRSDIGLLVIVDAATAGEHHPPGTWRRFDCRRGPCQSDLRDGEPNPASSGALDASPGRKPWVRDASTTSEPRRGDGGDGPYDLHGPGVQAAIELCTTLGTLPAEVWVYAVAAADTGYGEELSAPVAAAIGAMTCAIREDVRGWLTGGRCERA
jgi:Ni,Fe-hydrogenase maturation factor